MRQQQSQPTHEDADLILRFYDLRRQEQRRRARKWYLSEFPLTTRCGSRQFRLRCQAAARIAARSVDVRVLCP